MVGWGEKGKGGLGLAYRCLLQQQLADLTLWCVCVCMYAAERVEESEAVKEAAEREERRIQDGGEVEEEEDQYGEDDEGQRNKEETLGEALERWVSNYC